MKDVLIEPLSKALVNHFNARPIEEGGYEFKRDGAIVAVYIFDMRRDEDNFAASNIITKDDLATGEIDLHILVERDGYVASDIRPLDEMDDPNHLIMWIIESADELISVVSDEEYQDDWDDQVDAAHKDPNMTIFNFQTETDPEEFHIADLILLKKYNEN